MNGNMSLGALVAYVEYSRNCTWPMEMMGWLTNDLSSAVASYKKIKKIYEVKPEIEDSRNVVTLDHVSGNVEFDHVSLQMLLPCAHLPDFPLQQWSAPRFPR